MKKLLFIIISVLSLSSCKVLTSTDMFRTDLKFVYNSTNPRQRDIIIRPSDQLSIYMSPNNGLNLLESSIGIANNTTYINNNNITYLVEKDSTVKIPSVGRIKLGGYTINEAESLLEAKFSENYQNPFVRIKITNRKVIVFSELGTRATIVPLDENDLTLVDVIAKMGGISENSKAYRIKVIRGDHMNPMVYNFNLRSLTNYKNSNMLLEANDIIYVSSRPRYISRMISEVQPYLMLVSTSVLIYSVFTTNYSK